uniref:NADH-ubiquinone oxidoreductase chain 2 n=1 Tax=Gabronthus thermarum TaxID=878093 RepID=A0A0S2M7A8_9COLE|nr:NADH dehydrogenase subunit 2 [Gabronthus thermarum]ALO70579.1 NADH deshydrogenase subunit 2 [Gabronthus thermarum]
MFFNSLMIGTLISISSTSWIGMWMGLEINLLSIIPLMNSKNNLLSSEASLKYFITQALASTTLIFSIIFMLNNIPLLFNFKNNLMLMFNSALLTKMGAAPFHFWFPEIIDGLSWLNSLMILTWQKIAPMIILMYNLNFPLFFNFIIITSMLISGIMGFNQTSLRKILTYSSINHIAWMMAAMFNYESIWFFYFIVYTIITINIILIFNLINVFYMKQLFIMLNNNFPLKFFFIMNFLSLGGLPPFLGFMPKWLTIENLVKNNMMTLAIIMVILTLITLFFYIRLTFSTLTLIINEPNFSLKNKFNSFFIMSSNFLSITSLVLCTILLNMT